MDDCDYAYKSDTSTVSSNEDEQDDLSNEAHTRIALDIAWKCFQRVFVFLDGNVYPSAEYLMWRLPRELHEHFPADLVAALPGTGVLSPPDRVTTVEFRYRPARTLTEWDFINPNFDFGDVHCRFRELNIQEIPWYRDGHSWSETDEEEMQRQEEARLLYLQRWE
jgi:hypothetical protein